MLRQAVIQRIKASVPALDGRVYQAFLAPVGTGRPYVTVKLATERGSPGLPYAGDQPVEVRLYDTQADFANLDGPEAAVRVALNGATAIHDGERYYLRWVPGGGDFVDEERKLIGRVLLFEAAVLNEPA